MLRLRIAKESINTDVHFLIGDKIVFSRSSETRKSIHHRDISLPNAILTEWDNERKNA